MQWEFCIIYLQFGKYGENWEIVFSIPGLRQNSLHFNYGLDSNISIVAPDNRLWHEAGHSVGITFHLQFVRPHHPPLPVKLLNRVQKAGKCSVRQICIETIPFPLQIFAQFTCHSSRPPQWACLQYPPSSSSSVEHWAWLPEPDGIWFELGPVHLFVWLIVNSPPPFIIVTPVYGCF